VRLRAANCRSGWYMLTPHERTGENARGSGGGWGVRERAIWLIVTLSQGYRVPSLQASL
jgi:hypothetical protein